MQLFYDCNFVGDGVHSLSADQSHHCVNVMRMAVGAQVCVSDGKGLLAWCRVVEPNAKQCVVEVEKIENEYNKRNYRLDLAVAPTKNFDRVEWLVEKATEIGIDSFTPLLTSRCERRVVKLDRLERIAQSAAAQSQKAYLPQINPMTDFARFVEQNPNGLIAHCMASAEPKIPIPHSDRYTILIGPEGDFSPEELAKALKSGYQSITLGRQRLRTETAGLYATVAAAFFS